MFGNIIYPTLLIQPIASPLAPLHQSNAKIYVNAIRFLNLLCTFVIRSYKRYTAMAKHNLGNTDKT